VRQSLTDAPLARGRSAVEQVVVDRGEQATETAERDLREREDARGLVAVRRERDRSQLFFLERVEQRVRGVRRRVYVSPAPGRLEVGNARESRERSVEG